MRRSLIALIALFAAAPVAAQQTQAFHSADAGYTVQLPAGWERMPDAAVEALQRAGAQAGEGFAFEAGYRVTDVSSFVMGWVDMGQTLTPEQLAEEMVGTAGQAAMQEGADIANLGIRVDAPTWDAENRVVWTRLQKPSTAQGGARFSLNTFTLHPDGRTLVFFSYSAQLDADEARMRADLLRIIRSLRAD